MLKSITFLTTVLLVFPFIKNMMDTNPISIGVYDPGKDFEDMPLSYESDFFSWDVDPNTIRNFIKETSLHGRTPLITIEPWQNSSDPYGRNILRDTYEGKYDTAIDTICTTLNESDNTILIRWGHEMELKNSRYPWSNKDPKDYIHAYNYFAKRCKISTPQAKFVWSPAGEENSEAYWPDHTYVDYIGISVYSFKEWDIKYTGKQKTFGEIFSPKYNRLKQFNKPFVIAESGITGTEETKQVWINDILRSSKKYPLFEVLIYFNSKDVEGVWGPEFSTPDWRISRNMMETLTVR